MREYDAGETAYIEIETRDRYDILVDPSSVTVDIFDTDGNKVSTGLAAKEGTGNYFYTYTIPATAVKWEYIHHKGDSNKQFRLRQNQESAL